jgi:(p)ppGpp synthase/HD superfamily hydrolase
MADNSVDNKKSTKRLRVALDMATQLHAEQTRKHTTIPYLSHLLGVTSLVLEDGGSEDEAIAALLHDAVEDQGGLTILEEIRTVFGENVANIVLGCSDSVTNPKPPWRTRKEMHLKRLRKAPEAVIRVSLADKLHNARCILSDLRYKKDDIWQRFNGGKTGTLWYYHSLVKIFNERTDSAHYHELVLSINAIDELVE